MAALRAKILKMATVPVFALLAACGSSDSNQINVVVIGQAGDPFAQGVRAPFSAQLVRSAVAEGLVALDDQGRVIPALADRWIVTDDGKSYIFRLRDGTWQDGSEITAQSATRALRSSIRALGGTAQGLDLSGIEEVKEMAGRVVEIRLSYPMPHFLQLLAQPELGLTLPDGGTGPMRMTREGNVAVLTPIPPQQLGLPKVAKWDERVRAIGLTAMPGEEAVARFNAGEANVVLGGSIVDFPRTSSVGILRGTIHLDPVEGLFGLRVMAKEGFLADPDNREALSMALDREALITPFGVDGWKATTRIVPGFQEGDIINPGEERWSTISLEQRKARAASQVASWRQERDVQTIRVSIWMPQGPGSDMLFEQIAEDFGTVGVAAIRAAHKDVGDLRMVDTVSRYPRASWFLHRFNCKIGNGACVPMADGKLRDAYTTEDADQRAKLVAEANQLLNDANVFIPFGSPIRWALVRSDVTGFATNRWGWHPLMPMALRPK